MSTDFNFTVEDLTDETPASVLREQTKHLPNPGKGMVTSRAEMGRTNNDPYASAELQTLPLGQALMGIPIFDKPENAAQKSELIMSDLLGSTLLGHSDGELQKTDPDKGLGMFDVFVPDDITTAAKNSGIVREIQAGASDGTTGGGAGAEGINVGLASANGKALTGNTGNVRFRGAGGPTAKADIDNGKLAPNLIYILSILSQQVGMWITYTSTGQHATNSAHYSYRAVDLGALFIGSATWDAGQTNVHVLRKAMDVLNSITGPMRPSLVITNIPSSYPNFQQRSDHDDHMHIQVASFIEPPPQANTIPSTKQTVKGVF